MKKHTIWGLSLAKESLFIISGVILISSMLMISSGFAGDSVIEGELGAYLGVCRFTVPSSNSSFKIAYRINGGWGECNKGKRQRTETTWYRNSNGATCYIKKKRTTSSGCTQTTTSQGSESQSSTPVQTVGITYRQISSFESAVSRARDNSYIGYLGGLYPFLVYTAYMNYSGAAYTASSQAGVYDAGLSVGSVGVSTNMSAGSGVFSTALSAGSFGQSIKSSEGTPTQSAIISAGASAASNKSYFKPSEIPKWDLDFSVQGSVKESEIELTPVIGRQSDVKSIAVRFNGAKDDFALHSRMYFSSLTGTGNSDGQDTETIGIVLMPGYTLLNQNDNGINLSLFGLLELVSNDYGDAGNETRYVPGVGLNISGITPLGGMQLSYLFSHDRNGDGEEEITGDEFFNINTLSFRYILPLTKSLIFSTRLSYLWILDMPDNMEDSSADIIADLNYYGWKNYTIGLSYEHSIDGYETQGINLTVGYRW